MRGETKSRKPGIMHMQFQSTPLMRGETSARAFARSSSANFNPLPSCEGRQYSQLTSVIHRHFNPLPSCEGRRYSERFSVAANDFNPLPSCEGRLATLVIRILNAKISIHSPHARGDKRCQSGMKTFGTFQSTPLMRGETLSLTMCKRLMKFQSTPLMRGETR